jgi:methanogenic corrinoid protein MtbC1
VLLGGRAADEAAARRAGADATADDAQQAIRWFEGQAEAARSGRAGA